MPSRPGHPCRHHLACSIPAEGYSQDTSPALLRCLGGALLGEEALLRCVAHCVGGGSLLGELGSRSKACSFSHCGGGCHSD